LIANPKIKELDPNERANPKIKRIYKINLIDFIDIEFRTIPTVKQYLKSEIGIIKLINALNDSDIAIIGHFRTIIEQKKEIRELSSMKELAKCYNALNKKQKNKITKIIGKGKR